MLGSSRNSHLWAPRNSQTLGHSWRCLASQLQGKTDLDPTLSLIPSYLTIYTLWSWKEKCLKSARVRRRGRRRGLGKFYLYPWTFSPPLPFYFTTSLSLAFCPLAPAAAFHSWTAVFSSFPFSRYWTYDHWATSTAFHFDFLWDRVPNFPRLALNLRSTCLRLLRNCDCRCVPPSTCGICHLTFDVIQHQNEAPCKGSPFQMPHCGAQAFTCVLCGACQLIFKRQTESNPKFPLSGLSSSQWHSDLMSHLTGIYE